IWAGSERTGAGPRLAKLPPPAVTVTTTVFVDYNHVSMNLATLGRAVQYVLSPPSEKRDAAITVQPAIDPRGPRPQILKQQQVRPAILSVGKLGTANLCPTAIDA